MIIIIMITVMIMCVCVCVCVCACICLSAGWLEKLWLDVDEIIRVDFVQLFGLAVSVS